MTSIKFESMTLENFKCFKTFEIVFREKETEIKGKNATAKTTIADAIMWLLFDTDYDLKSNPQVRREVDGAPINDVDTAVELKLAVDGKPVTMKKIQRREFKNETAYRDYNLYYVNEVPVKLADFHEKLGVQLDVLKMSLSPKAFLALKSAEMRSQLFAAADDVSDKELAASNPELEELIPLLEDYTADELTAMHKATIAKAKTEQPIMLGQIKEKEHDIAAKELVNIAELETRKLTYIEQIAKVKEEMQSIETPDELRTKLAEINNKLKFAKDYAQTKLDELEEQIERNDRKAESTKITIESIKRLSDDAASGIQSLEEKIDTLKSHHFAEDEKDLYCPTCGALLSEEKIKESRENYDKDKADKLEAFNSRLSEQEKVHGVYQKQIQNYTRDYNSYIEARDKAQESYKTYAASANAVDGEAYADDNFTDTTYAPLVAERNEIASKLSADTSNEQLYKLDKKLGELCEEKKTIDDKIAQSDTAQDEARLIELRAELLNNEQNKANSEKVIYLLTELEKIKNTALTAAINENFKLVEWQLFEYAKNGNYKNCCIPKVEGKSILDSMSNKGNKMLGKVDICCALQRLNGITCPIILDDCESLDSGNRGKVCGMVDGQLIMMIVTDGEVLSA